MAIEVMRYGPDTGGAYVSAMTCASAADALSTLRNETHYMRRRVTAVGKPSHYPEFMLVEVTLRSADGGSEPHLFLIPTERKTHERPA